MHIYHHRLPFQSTHFFPCLCDVTWHNEVHLESPHIDNHWLPLRNIHEHSHTHPLNPSAPHLDPLVSWSPCFSLSPNIRQQFAPTHLSIHLQLLNLVSFLANHFKSMLGSRKPVNLCKSCGYSGAVQLVATQPQTRIQKPKRTPNNA